MTFSSRRAAAGFTLVEVLTVVAILGILAAIAVPTARRAIQWADSSHCLANLRQLNMAAELYRGDNNMESPRVNFWPEDLSIYLLPGEEAITDQPPGRRDSPFYCPAADPDDVPQTSVHSANVTYGQNGTRYGGLKVMAMRYQGDDARPEQLVTYMDGKLYNLFDSTIDRVPFDWHGGHANACFADGHAEVIKVTPGSAEWYNLFWGYKRF